MSPGRRRAATLLLIVAACTGGRGAAAPQPPVPAAHRVAVPADTLVAGDEVRQSRLWLVAGFALVALVYVIVRALGNHNN